MDQPNFETVAANLQSIQHEVSLVGNMPAVVGLADLRQELNANHTQIVALLAQIRGQFVEVQDHFGELQDQFGDMQVQMEEIQGQVGEVQGQVGEIQGQIQQLQQEYLCPPLPS